jgi:hypothetical protein
MGNGIGNRINQKSFTGKVGMELLFLYIPYSHWNGSLTWRPAAAVEGIDGIERRKFVQSISPLEKQGEAFPARNVPI